MEYVNLSWLSDEDSSGGQLLRGIMEDMKEQQSYPFDFDDQRRDQYDLGYRLGHRDGWGSAMADSEGELDVYREGLGMILQLCAGDHVDPAEIRSIARTLLGQS
jgi:hypothetical protein